MAFCIIAGITVPIKLDTAKEAKPTLVGSQMRTHNGTLRSTVRAEKREWECQTALLTLAQKQALKAATNFSQQITVSGDMFDSTSIGAVVDFDDVQMVQSGGLKFRITLRIRET